MGLRAYLTDLRDKIKHDPLPPERVAAGWALGMFVGCFIPFGLQLIVSVPLAFRWRVSKIGATIGTLVTNPVTIFFIYPVQCWVGSRIIGAPLSWEHLTNDVYPVLKTASFFSAKGLEAIASLGWSVLGGFFAGGLLLALILTPPTYLIVYRLITRYRQLRNPNS